MVTWIFAQGRKAPGELFHEKRTFLGGWKGAAHVQLRRRQTHEKWGRCPTHPIGWNHMGLAPDPGGSGWAADPGVRILRSLLAFPSSARSAAPRSPRSFLASRVQKGAHNGSGA